MRSEQEIKNAIVSVFTNKDLSFAYREDIEEVLLWVLGERNSFDGLHDYITGEDLEGGEK